VLIIGIDRQNSSVFFGIAGKYLTQIDDIAAHPRYPAPPKP
jgi:hypothetical protein